MNLLNPKSRFLFATVGMITLLSAVSFVLFAVQAQADTLQLPTWTTPVNISKNPQSNSFIPKIVVDTHGNQFFFWSEANFGTSVPSTFELFFSKYENGSFTTPVPVFGPRILPNSAFSFDIAIDKQNVIHLVYAIDWQTFYKKYSNGVWSLPETVTLKGGAATVAVDSNNNPHVMYIYPFYYPNSGAGTHYTRRTESRWTGPLLLTSDTGQPNGINKTMAIDEHDNIHIVWIDTGPLGGYLSQIIYRKFDGASWSDPKTIVTGYATVWAGIESKAGITAIIYNKGIIIPNKVEDEQVYILVSKDAGNTWTDPIKISEPVAMGSPWTHLPALSIDSTGDIHTMWGECGYSCSPPVNNGVPYRFYRGGRLSTVQDISGGTLVAAEPYITTTGDKIYAAWISDNDIYYSSAQIVNQVPQNQPPTPSFPMTGPYAGDGIDPNKGTANATPFFFKTIYTDADNSPPSDMALVVDDGMAVSRHSMTLDMEAPDTFHDGNYANGEQYTFTSQFPRGDYRYHFEATDGTNAVRIPASDLSFRSGLIVVVKSSVNIRSDRGTSASIIGTAQKGDLLELFPLCSETGGTNCNDDALLYTLKDGHYWFKVKWNNLVGFIVEDFVMTIVPKNQPERVKKLMTEVFAQPDFTAIQSFPIELPLAIAAHESGGTLNNEITSVDSPFSGIMQVHPSTSGWNRNCVGNICKKMDDYWTKIKNPFTDIFDVSTNNKDSKVFMLKNYISTSYQNTDDGLRNNIFDGLKVLTDKYGKRCPKESFFFTDSLTGTRYELTCSDMEKIRTTWAYNGFGDNYLAGISDALNHLLDTFPGVLYQNSDQLIEKLAVANNHRIEVKKYSPVDLRVYDSLGAAVGEFNGEVKDEIYNGVYDPATESIAILFPQDTYTYTVVGTATSTYGLAINSVNDATTTAFLASEIPIKLGEVYSYQVDFKALSRGEKGVTVKVDENGDGIFDYQFTASSILEDKTPPTTHISPAGTSGMNGWYTSDVTVTLIAEDNDGGVGVRRTEYSLNNGVTWQTYAVPLIITQEGVSTLLYRSIDFLGNLESTHTQTVKIDKTPPEAKIYFDKDTQTLKVEGTDNLTPNPSVTSSLVDLKLTDADLKAIDDDVLADSNEAGVPPFHSATMDKKRVVYQIQDDAGHTLTISFKRLIDKNHLFHAFLDSLQYDSNPPMVLRGATLNALWLLDKNSNYKYLSQRVVVQNQFNVHSAYNKLQDKTVVWIVEKGKKIRQQTLSGLIIIKLNTKSGGLTYEL